MHARYRFKDGDWKERGLGDSKLLRHKACLTPSTELTVSDHARLQVSGKVRYMLRQEKTGKIAGLQALQVLF